jgi:hypothetical protein
MPTGTPHSEMDARRACRGRWRYTLGCCRFEEEREVSPADEAAIRAALEAVGISFSFEIANGRARPAGVTYSPRHRNEGH